MSVCVPACVRVCAREEGLGERGFQSVPYVLPRKHAPLTF